MKDNGHRYLFLEKVISDLMSCVQCIFSLIKKSYLNDIEKYPKFQLIASAYVPNPVLPMCGRPLPMQNPTIQQKGHYF